MSEGKLTILILGGYGAFGGRLARLLADEERLRLVVAGRSLDAAKAFCARLETRGELVALAFDRDGAVEAQLSQLQPDLVVDASGPFQAYGDDPYRLVRAAIRLGIDYIDLADGSDFVDGIAAFDEGARRSGVFVLAGASSFPALTTAVVRKLSQGMARLERVTGGLAPSPYARVGLNVIRSVAVRAGQPTRLRRDGKAAIGYPSTETCRATIGPPGRLPLHSNLFSLVDVPDLNSSSSAAAGTPGH